MTKNVGHELAQEAMGKTAAATAEVDPETDVTHPDTVLQPQQAEVSATSAPEPEGNKDRFEVSLAEFAGPFEVLLSLITKHKLEVTELALHQVTDDFIQYIRAQGNTWDLDETTEFLLIAATLLDLKAVRLLPSGDVEDDEDLELLEARDLLFARLLQYRAFKSVSAQLAALLSAGERRMPRSVALEPQFAQLLPEVVFALGPAGFADLASEVLAPKPPPEVSVTHVHAPPVSVAEQANFMVAELRVRKSATFRSLIRHAESTLVVVARFLALLELYRGGLVAFEQAAGLAELHIRWVGGDAEAIAVSDFDGPQSDRN